MAKEGDNEATAAAPQAGQPSARQVCRQVLEMVGALHALGYESLYINPRMAPSGMNWRYAIGSMRCGRWPDPIGEIVVGSIGGSPQGSLPWCAVGDDPTTYKEKFVDVYRDELSRAQRPNPEYVSWYQRMLEETGPEGLLIFSSDYGSHYEYAYVWGEPSEFRMPMPPGFRGRPG